MDIKYKIIGVLILLFIFFIYKSRQKIDLFSSGSNIKRKRTKKNKKNKQDDDEFNEISEELYEEIHEQIVDGEEIDIDDLEEIDDRIDSVILLSIEQLYSDKDHSKIKVKDYKKILKKNLND